VNKLLSQLNQRWEHELSLTDKSQLEQLEKQADSLLIESSDFEALKKLEQLAIDENAHLGIQLAVKLAISKGIVNRIHENIFVSVVFAVYCEHNRILTNEQHPNGEDFLNRKLEQLQWLFDGNKNIDWELIVVDDGCPNNSGKLAEEILGADHPHAKVLFLQDGVHEKHRATIALANTDESRKGGSVLYGMAKAIENNKNGKHIVVFTDADLSTHLGQTGLLLKPILSDNKKAAIGSRRETNSVVIKKGLRNTRGKLFIYLWKRLLPQLNYIIDTQCGFKAFDSNLLSKIVYNMEEKKFAFDIELLLKTELIEKDKIEKVGIAWIDSDAESTTGVSTYLDMLHSIVKFYRKYITPNWASDQWANFIEGLDQEKWDDLLDNMPEVIEKTAPSELGNDLIKVEGLSKLIK